MPNDWSLCVRGRLAVFSAIIFSLAFHGLEAQRTLQNAEVSEALMLVDACENPYGIRSAYGDGSSNLGKMESQIEITARALCGLSTDELQDMAQILYLRTVRGSSDETHWETSSALKRHTGNLELQGSIPAWNKAIDFAGQDLYKLIWFEDFLFVDSPERPVWRPFYKLSVVTENGFPKVDLRHVPEMGGGDFSPGPRHCYIEFLVNSAQCHRRSRWWKQ